MTSTVNVADVERWASALGGVALTAYGLKQIRRRWPAAAVLAATGGALVARGATGHCPVYAATGVNTRVGPRDTRLLVGGRRSVDADDAVTVMAPAEALFGFWRRFEMLPRFMDHLVSVSQLDRRRSYWIAKAAAGGTVEWEAELVDEVDGEQLAWRSVDGAEVSTAGSVTFRPVADGAHTEVRVKLRYDAPAGRVNRTIGWLFCRNPAPSISDDLERFKRLMETGEMVAR